MGKNVSYKAENYSCELLAERLFCVIARKAEMMLCYFALFTITDSAIKSTRARTKKYFQSSNPNFACIISFSMSN